MGMGLAMSLRIKLMLALLLTGLATVAMVGGLAYVGINSKVDVIRRQQAADHFYKFMDGYLQKYGSWQAANAVEPFDVFVQGMRAKGGLDGAEDAQAGAARAPGPPPDGERNGPPE